MADIELVIKIPEEMYKWVNDVNKFFDDYGMSDFIDLVKKGTPLPKGHGRLIDADEIDNYMLPSEKQDKTWFVHSEEYRNAVPHFNHAMRLLRDNAQTIIPADKEEEE